MFTLIMEKTYWTCVFYHLKMRKDPFGFYDPPQSYESSTLCYYAHHTTSVGIKGQGRFVTEIQNFTVKNGFVTPLFNAWKCTV